MNLHLITVPYRYDEREAGVGLGPAAVLGAGLVARLTSAGWDVTPPVAAFLNPEHREAGRTAVNIGKLGADTARLVADARRTGAPVLVLTGDDTAAVGILSGIQAAEAPGARIGVVWFDAHGDFNTPETSFSGILAGMPLAIIAGLAGPQWRGASGLAAPIPTDRILIAGTRDLDEQEERLIRSTSVRLVTADEVRGRRRFQEQLDRLAASSTVLMLQVDLDVLDPHLVPSSSTPSEHGLQIAEAVEAISAVLATGKVGVVTFSSLNPGGGQRGNRSIATALTVIERTLEAWRRIAPDEPRVTTQS